MFAPPTVVPTSSQITDTPVPLVQANVADPLNVEPGGGLVIPAGTDTASGGTAPDAAFGAAAMTASHARTTTVRVNERRSLKADVNAPPDVLQPAASVPVEASTHHTFRS
jgi:hypothetical protein